MKSSPDYYELLEIPRDASKEDIKKAFRKQAIAFHPDRNKSPNAETRFKLINEAYATLSDPEKRNRYDRYGQSETVTNPFHGSVSQSDFRDIFGTEIFNELFASLFGQRRRKPSRGDDIEIDLSINLEDILQGGPQEVDVPRHQKCSRCNGRGYRSPHPVRCSTCRGSGKHKIQRGFLAMVQQCTDCNGSGLSAKDLCSLCYGKGVAREISATTVNIPAGIEDGHQLCIKGAGDHGPQSRGDLFVNIRIKPHPLFERDQLDLLITQSLRYTELVLGTLCEIQTLDQRSVKLKVPAGTPAGQILRLRGKGLPSVHGRRVGDLLVKVEVIIPKAMTATERKLTVALHQYDPLGGGNKVIQWYKVLANAISSYIHLPRMDRKKMDDP